MLDHTSIVVRRGVAMRRTTRLVVLVGTLLAAAAGVAVASASSGDDAQRDTKRLEVLRVEGRGGTTKVLDHDQDRKSTRLNSSHANISYAVFCLKKKKNSHRTLIS